jgi:hypothetical protein
VTSKFASFAQANPTNYLGPLPACQRLDRTTGAFGFWPTRRPSESPAQEINRLEPKLLEIAFRTGCSGSGSTEKLVSLAISAEENFEEYLAQILTGAKRQAGQKTLAELYAAGQAKSPHDTWIIDADSTLSDMIGAW